MANSSELIIANRKRQGLTQGALAARAGTSRERINSYERGHVSPASDTLERVLGALDAELSTTPALTYEDRRSLAISTAVAEHLIAGPARVIAKAGANLSTMRASASHEHPWLDVWEALLSLGPAVVADLLTSKEQFARDLRQSSPFAGVLTDDERARATAGLRRR
jgi:transcriptional regulator with XRE-family HTH domain